MSFNGSFEIGDANGITLAQTGHPRNSDPIVVTAATFANGSSQAESLDGMLVKLPNVSFSQPGGTFAGLTNYTVASGSSTVAVRVSTNQQDVVGTQIPAEQVDLIGILSEFDAEDPAPGVPGSGYQLLLRTRADIVSNGPAGSLADVASLLFQENSSVPSLTKEKAMLAGIGKSGVLLWTESHSDPFLRARFGRARYEEPASFVSNVDNSPLLASLLASDNHAPKADDASEPSRFSQANEDSQQRAEDVFDAALLTLVS